MRASLYTVDVLGQEDAALLRGVADLLVVAFAPIYDGDVTRALADVVQFAPEDLSLIARDQRRAAHRLAACGALQAAGLGGDQTRRRPPLAPATTRRADPRPGGGGADARGGCVTMLATVGDTRGRTSLYGVDVTADAPPPRRLPLPCGPSGRLLPARRLPPCRRPPGCLWPRQARPHARTENQQWMMSNSNEQREAHGPDSLLIAALASGRLGLARRRSVRQARCHVE